MLRHTKLLLSALSACALLCSCVSTVKQGPVTSAQVAVAVDSQTVAAQKTADQMTKLWLPAKTTFAVGMAADPNDGFSTALLNELRQKGYALVECYSYQAPNTLENRSGKAKGIEVISMAETLAKGASKLTWDFSTLGPCTQGEACFYRVTVYVNDTQLSRAYQLSDDQLMPVGAWSLGGGNDNQ